MKRSRKNAVVLIDSGLLLTFLLCQLVFTSPVDSAITPTSARPKIGLVLSGGGARGAAHIGVLKVLEELKIPIDYIAGTSMGSIVGGLYASGMNPDEIEKALTSVDWNDTFSDDPRREGRSFRRKQDDYIYLVKSKAGFNDGDIDLPSGLIQGQKIDLLFNSLTMPVTEVDDFDKLDIPFRAVATDIVTGVPVILRSGNLARSMRASMSVPAAFAAVEIEGHLLVDGGVSDNLPIDVARQMGADIIIAVDVSTPLSPRDKLTSSVAITEQLTGILSRRNTDQQIATLTKNDFLIVPDLGDISTAGFVRAAEAIPKGVIAAELQRPRLEELSLSQAAYATYIVARRAPANFTLPVIDYVEIDNKSRIGDDVLASYLHIEIGKPLDETQLQTDIGRIYGLELFETVNYQVVQKESGECGLIIHVKERSWGPNYIQGGLASSNNFQGETNFNVGFAYTRTAINSLAGEWRTALQIGTDPAIATELFQPLDIYSRYFINPALFYQDTNYYEYENEDQVAEYRVKRYGASLAVGRQLGEWGEFRLGYRRFAGEAKVLVGPSSQADYNFDDGLVFAKISLDTFNNISFPTRGSLGSIEFTSASEALGSDTNYQQVQFNLGVAKTWGRHTLISSVTFDTTLNNDAPLESLFRAGGLLNLSGFNQDELSGQQYGLLRLAYFRRFGDFRLMPIYLGGSLEQGNVWNCSEDVSLTDTLTAGSLFIGLDTPIGPFYLGYGQAEYHNSSLYLYFGKLF